MSIEKGSKTLEEEIELLHKRAEHSSVTIGEILHILPERGRCFLLILLSLPFCLPLQIPGLSTPFGLAIAFIGSRMIFGKRVWLPKKLMHKPISAIALKKITSKALWLIKKMRRWIRPRLNWICRYRSMHSINGALIAFLGIFLALPLPIPLSNLAAAWSIFLIALGELEDDGLFVILGYIASLLTLIFFIGIVLSIEYLTKSH